MSLSPKEEANCVLTSAMLFGSYPGSLVELRVFKAWLDYRSNMIVPRDPGFTMGGLFDAVRQRDDRGIRDGGEERADASFGHLRGGERLRQRRDVDRRESSPFHERKIGTRFPGGGFGAYGVLYSILRK